jgi:hypothetical protein
LTGLVGVGLDAALVVSASARLRYQSWCCLSVTSACSCVVLRRDLGLLLQLVEVGVQLAQDVLDPRQVLARVVQPVLGLAAALLVLGDARGLFQEQAQFLGLDSMIRLIVPWPMMA